MEGLIPYLVRAIKRQNIHKHSYRCLSDGSRRSYHLLGSAGESFNGSSHRRTQSQFQAPTAMDLQPQVDQFVRSRSIKSNNINTDNSSQGLRPIHHHNTSTSAAYNYNYNYDYDYGSQTIYKLHQS